MFDTSVVYEDVDAVHVGDSGTDDACVVGFREIRAMTVHAFWRGGAGVREPRAIAIHRDNLCIDTRECEHYRSPDPSGSPCYEHTASCQI
jgi:hypothetical protein